MPGAGNVNWEVEQKYVLQDRGSFLSRLDELGFKQDCVQQHSDIYFRHPCRDFRKTDEAFRLRQLDEQTFVTYKGKRTDAAVKTRPEIELTLVSAEYDQWTQLLGHLGFEPLPAVRKMRHVFKHADNSTNTLEYEGFVVTLDEVEQLGQFAELELIVSRSAELDEAHMRIEQLAKRLDLIDVQPLSYLAQLLVKIGLE